MHKEFTEVYDIFMKHVDYKGWYKFLKTYMKTKGEVLDLGCGTGEFIYRLLKDDFAVTGVDISEGMLEMAEKKIKSKNLKNNDYKLIKKDIINYEHNNEADYIMCNFDTVNYFENKQEFKKFIAKSYKNLKKGGYLIFDIVDKMAMRYIAVGNSLIALAIE